MRFLVLLSDVIKPMRAVDIFFYLQHSSRDIKLEFKKFNSEYLKESESYNTQALTLKGIKTIVKEFNMKIVMSKSDCFVLAKLQATNCI